MTPKCTSSSPAHGRVGKPWDAAVAEAEGVDGAERRSEDRALGRSSRGGQAEAAGEREESLGAASRRSGSRPPRQLTRTLWGISPVAEKEDVGIYLNVKFYPPFCPGVRLGK